MKRSCSARDSDMDISEDTVLKGFKALNASMWSRWCVWKSIEILY